MCGRASCTLGADDIPRAYHRTLNMDRFIEMAVTVFVTCGLGGFLEFVIIVFADKLKNDRKMNTQIPRNTSVKPEPSESPEEHERDVNLRASSEKSKDCLAKRSSVTVSQIKWDREDISSESKSGMDDCSKIGISPKIRKKGSLKTGNDNQSTLFQYFGRK
ncbi:hypothetical protein SDJN02_24725, partial [Cucurbita argyrosperma subsp. argyrosperma]